MTSPELVQLMSWRTFYTLLSRLHPQVIVGRRQSDMCDHCHLWPTRIVLALGARDMGRLSDVEAQVLHVGRSTRSCWKHMSGIACQQTGSGEWH